MEKVLTQCNMCSYAGVWAEVEFFRNMERGLEHARGAGIWSWVLKDERVFQTEETP